MPPEGTRGNGINIGDGGLDGPSGHLPDSHLVGRCNCIGAAGLTGECASWCASTPNRRAVTVPAGAVPPHKGRPFRRESRWRSDVRMSSGHRHPRNTRREGRPLSWARVDLNHRPHAYQACPKEPISRHLTGVSASDGAICRVPGWPILQDVGFC